MLIEVRESTEIEETYGPDSTDASLVSALEETIGETNVKVKKERAKKDMKTPVLDKTSLFFARSFSLTFAS
jgi:hypothetical protein